MLPGLIMKTNIKRDNLAGVAQLVEHLICNQGVMGSSPIASNYDKQRRI